MAARIDLIGAASRRPKAHAVVLQVCALIALLTAGWWLAGNAAANLEARHIASGFGFLDDSAGFAISESLLPYEAGNTYARAFVVGVANTARAALPAVVFASVFGFVAGVAQISRYALVRVLAIAYVDVVRNVPLLVQLLLWYFSLTALLPGSEYPLQLGRYAFLGNGGLVVAVPELDATQAIALVALSLALLWAAWRAPRGRGLAVPAALALVLIAWLLWPQAWQYPTRGAFGVTGGASLSSEWLALVAALTVYAGAYCAEIVRAGLQAVPRAQWEATHALGLTRIQTLVRVIIPQALRVIVPPYTSLVMNTVKNSSLAVAIGYPDIVSVATTSLNQNGQAIECITIIAGVYLLLNLITALLMGVVNARVQLKER